MTQISITLEETHRVMDYLELTTDQRKKFMELLESWQNVFE